MYVCVLQVQLPAVDPAKQFAVDFRMQATSYAAYMMVRDYQTVGALAGFHGGGSRGRAGLLQACPNMHTQQHPQLAAAFPCIQSLHAPQPQHLAATRSVLDTSAAVGGLPHLSMLCAFVDLCSHLSAVYR